MNQEECLQIVRASTRARKYVMVQQEKSLSEPKTYSRNLQSKKIDKVSTSSMKIKPTVYTESLKCL